MAAPPRLQVPLPPVFLEYPGDPRVRWSNWSAQLDNFFSLTNLTLAADQQLSDRAKNAYLASLLGSEGNRILMAHPAAATAGTATYATFKAAVQRLFERSVNLVCADFDFRSRCQGAHESVNEHSIAMQLAIGCYNRHTQERLLKETNISLTRFRDIMEADETAQASSTAMRGAPTFAFVASTILSSGPKRHVHHTNHTTGMTGSRCLGCGHTGHAYKSTDCPAHGKLCRSCGNMHHF